MVTFYAIHSKFFPTFSKHPDIMHQVNTLSCTQRSMMLDQIKKDDIRSSALSFFDEPVYEEEDDLLLQMHQKCVCRIHFQNGIVYADTINNPFLELLMRIYPCHIMEVSE